MKTIAFRLAILHGLLLLLSTGLWPQDRQPVEQVKNSQAAKPKPPNEAQVSVHSITPSPSGISVSLTVSQLEVISASIEKQNRATGTWLPFVNYASIPVPGDMRNTREPVDGTINWPVTVSADPSIFYRMTVWVKSRDEEEMDWRDAAPMTFSGYKPFVAQTLKLSFGADALKISAQTSTIATLKAAWQFAGDYPMAMQASEESQSPNVTLPFAALQVKSNASIPSMFITLEDTSTHQVQEARVTVEISTTPSVKGQLDQVNKQTDQGKRDKTKFSWGDLAKTGASALLKYFSIVGPMALAAD